MGEKFISSTLATKDAHTADYNEQNQDSHTGNDVRHWTERVRIGTVGKKSTDRF